MAPQKRYSGESFGESSCSSVKRSTPPPSPTTKQCSVERLTLPDGKTAHRVPAPCNSRNPTIPFYDNGTPGVSVKNVLGGGCVQDSPEPDFKAGSLKVVFQWPGYDYPNVPHPRPITINPNTKQELTVTVCTALHKFYSSLVVENDTFGCISPMGLLFTSPLRRYHTHVLAFRRWRLGSGVLCSEQYT
jgi:hypothetical protein